MNLQQFLEEEIIDFGIDFGHAKNCDLQPPNDGEQMCSCGYEQLESAVKNMNTRLVNKVLDEVKREVEKELIHQLHLINADEYTNDILLKLSNKVDQLKLK